MLKSVPHIVRAKTYHGRYGSIKNAFHYGVNFVLLPMTPHVKQKSASRYFSLNKWNLIYFRNRDHGDGREQSVEWARNVAKEYKVNVATTDQIWLLTQPRILGYVFNPVSFWFFTHADGALFCVIAEVNNTFGDRHSYICYHDDFRPILTADRLKARKVFHVSPFQDVAGDYCFRFTFSSKAVGVWIDYKDGENGLYATLTGRTLAMTNKAVLKMLLHYPLGAMRVIALIHWQALKLAVKGSRYRTRPEPPQQEVSR